MGIFDKFKNNVTPTNYTIGDIKRMAQEKLAMGAYENAAKYLMEAGKIGDADSQYELAMLCHKGKSRLLNDSEILIWLEKAASQGHLAAQMELGDMYKYGLCGLDDEDYDKGIYWFTKASEQGDTDAMVTVGDMYVVVGEKEKAREWYQRAYDAGCEYALKEIEMLDEDYDDEDDDFDYNYDDEE